MHTANLKENGLLQPVHLLSGRGDDFLQDSSAKMGKTLIIFRVACFNRLLMKGHCSWSLKPSVYPDMVKAKIPIFAAVLSLESSYELPAAGYFVWGSSFLWNRGGLYLGHSWVPSPCIPPQHAFSVENKLFLGNNLLKASFLPAGTSEPWRSVAQKGCKAEGSMERSPPGWIHTIVTWYLISGWMQLLVQFPIASEGLPVWIPMANIHFKTCLKRISYLYIYPWSLTMSRSKVAWCSHSPDTNGTWCSREIEEKLLSALLQLLVCHCC